MNRTNRLLQRHASIVIVGMFLSLSLFSGSATAQQPGGALIEDLKSRWRGVSDQVTFYREEYACRYVTGTYGYIRVDIPNKPNTGCQRPWCDSRTNDNVVGALCFTQPTPNETARFCELYIPWMPERTWVGSVGVNTKCMNFVGDTTIVNGICMPGMIIQFMCTWSPATPESYRTDEYCFVFTGMLGCFAFHPVACTRIVDVMCVKTFEPPVVCYVYVRTTETCVEPIDSEGTEATICSQDVEVACYETRYPPRFCYVWRKLPKTCINPIRDLIGEGEQ